MKKGESKRQNIKSGRVVFLSGGIVFLLFFFLSFSSIIKNKTMNIKPPFNEYNSDFI